MKTYYNRVMGCWFQGNVLNKHLIKNWSLLKNCNWFLIRGRLQPTQNVRNESQVKVGFVCFFPVHTRCQYNVVRLYCLFTLEDVVDHLTERWRLSSSTSLTCRSKHCGGACRSRATRTGPAMYRTRPNTNPLNRQWSRVRNTVTKTEEVVTRPVVIHQSRGRRFTMPRSSTRPTSPCWRLAGRPVALPQQPPPRLRTKAAILLPPQP